MIIMYRLETVIYSLGALSLSLASHVCTLHGFKVTNHPSLLLAFKGPCQCQSGVLRENALLPAAERELTCAERVTSRAG